MSTERQGSALPSTNEQDQRERGTATEGGAAGKSLAAIPIVPDPDREAVEFVRFCYRRRAVAWPELYDEMCAVAARGDYRGMTYEQLEGLGIGFALAALPRLAATVARVVAEERERHKARAVA